MGVFEQRRFCYAFAGGLLSAGAPLGLLALRTSWLSLYSVSAIWTEIVSLLPIYLYVSATTAVAFAVFGYVLGVRADELHRLSTTDALTGLSNRRALNNRLGEEYRRSRRYRTPLSLLLVDLDELKRVNDLQGHAAGDRAIRRTAGAIRMTLRNTDIGGRWGGDEFLIIAPSTASAASCTIAERLRGQLAKHDPFGDPPATVSIGIATLDPNRDEPDSPESLMQAADAALHRAKSAGRNLVRVA